MTRETKERTAFLVITLLVILLGIWVWGSEPAAVPRDVRPTPSVVSSSPCPEHGCCKPECTIVGG